MDLARSLAERGRYTVAPNPLVGAVVARDGTAISECWHARAGCDHAEIGALKEAGDAARGATMYTTLEPCNHHGRKPPCAPALVEAGVIRVVAAVQDPDDRVDGSGFTSGACQNPTLTMMAITARACDYIQREYAKKMA